MVVMKRCLGRNHPMQGIKCCVFMLTGMESTAGKKGWRPERLKNTPSVFVCGWGRICVSVGMCACV